MISTGGAMASAIAALIEQGSLPEIAIAATRGLLIGDAAERFTNLTLQRMIVTDTGLSLARDASAYRDGERQRSDCRLA
jgi:phosphoribosylpyrophosphate synthetase